MYTSTVTYGTLHKKVNVYACTYGYGYGCATGTGMGKMAVFVQRDNSVGSGMDADRSEKNITG